MAYPISIETTPPAATVRLPSNEPLLVGWGGDTPSVNYHVTIPDSRWAYDLMVEPISTGNRLVIGHTHRQAVRYLSDSPLWLNPGSVSYRRFDDLD